MNQDQMKKVAVVAGTVLGAYFLYKIIVKKQNPVKAAQDTIQKPIEIVKDTADAVVKVGKKGLRYFTKGSQEAKDYMAKLRSMQNGKKKSSVSHKGHATKRGLAQDQKLVSNEAHEKAYQKKKIALPARVRK